MITPTQMYWLVKLDDIRSAIKGIMFIPAICIAIVAIMIMAAFFACIDADKDTKSAVAAKIRRSTLWCVPLLFMMLAINMAVALIPTTKQMAAIIVVPSIANSEKVQTVGNKLYDLAVEWMNELKPRQEGRTER